MSPAAASRSPARAPILVAAAFDLESLLRRDRLVVVIALVAVIVLSWAYILAGAGMGMSAFEMTQMTQSVGVSDSTQPSMQEMSTGGTAADSLMATGTWTVGYAVVIFLMWWVMMLGMMLPSAAPLLLLFARMMRKEKGHRTCRRACLRSATWSCGRPSVPLSLAPSGAWKLAASCPA